MNRIIASLFLLCAIFFLAPPAASAVTIQWSPVGNAGNANDVGTGSLYGGVAYNYNIGTYDVTNSQYAEFLNTKDPGGANTLGLWNSNMANGTYGGISFNGGNPSGSKYVLTAGRQNHPVNYETWYSAIRFANWLNNGQGSGDTETGAYTLGALFADGIPTNGSSIVRNPGATVFLPSESEWYKAAYYDGPNTGGYFIYATSNNAIPNASGPTATPNSANYNNAVGNLTDVGVYTGTTSPYGAFDMNGNVYQWNEALISGSLRGMRGGLFANTAFFLQSSSRNIVSAPSQGNGGLGFRVASVPEPSTAVLAVVACGLMWVLRKRFS